MTRGAIGFCLFVAAGDKLRADSPPRTADGVREMESRHWNLGFGSRRPLDEGNRLFHRGSATVSC